MKTRAAGTAAALLLAVAASGEPARAEVSAEVDALGRYVRMIVTSNSLSRNVRIWGVTVHKPMLRPLNVEGDENGDLFPAVGETFGLERNPWVVWSRFAGTNYDLAFSLWDPQSSAWRPIAWVQPATSPGDDFSPALAFDVDSRPHLIWSREEAGVGRVYLTLWLQTRWMTEYLVSDPGTHSVVPSIRLLSDGRIEVQYDTPTERVTRIVVFNRPWTITDDITPFGRFRIDETVTTPLGPR